MNYKTLGWIQIIGGALALLFSGRVGYTGMMGMMGYYGGYNMMTMGSGLGGISSINTYFPTRKSRS